MDSNNPLPLYYQLKQELIRRLDEGEIVPGAIMPSEAELMSEYQVSRATVRKAYEDLSAIGRITKKRGIGAFANYPPIEKGISRLTGFTEDILSRGGVPSSIIRNQSLIVADEEAAKKLCINPGDKVNYIERIRLDNNIPIAMETSYIPNDLCKDLYQLDLEKNSLYKLFEDQYNLEFSTATQSLEPQKPTSEDINDLDLDADELLLYMERTTYLADQRPVELTYTKYRSSKFKFWVTLRR